MNSNFYDITRQLSTYAEPFLGILSVIFIIFAEVTNDVIYPIPELAVQTPLMCIYCFVLYMVIICKHKRIMDMMKFVDH